MTKSFFGLTHSSWRGLGFWTTCTGSFTAICTSNPPPNHHKGAGRTIYNDVTNNWLHDVTNMASGVRAVLWRRGEYPVELENYSSTRKVRTTVD